MDRCHALEAVTYANPYLTGAPRQLWLGLIGLDAMHLGHNPHKLPNLCSTFIRHFLHFFALFF